MRDYDGAISEYDEALRLAPSFTAARINRGTAWFGKKDYDRAIADYTESIRVDPKFALAFNNRGLTYLAKHDPDAKDRYERFRLAFADFTKAIRLARNDPKSAANYYRNRGNVYIPLLFLGGAVDEAIKNYNKAIRLDPNSAWAYFDRGVAYSLKDDLDRTISDYSKAIELAPNSAFLYLKRGETFARSLEFDRAIADFSEAGRLNPDSREPLLKRSDVWLRKREWERGAAEWIEAAADQELVDRRKSCHRVLDRLGYGVFTSESFLELARIFDTFRCILTHVNDDGELVDQIKEELEGVGERVPTVLKAEFARLEGAEQPRGKGDVLSNGLPRGIADATEAPAARVVDNQQNELRENQIDGVADNEGRRAVSPEVRRETKPTRIRDKVLDLPTLPRGLKWPTETYSEAQELYGENVVEFLERVWLPLIEAGVAERRLVSMIDYSVIDGIKNYCRTNPRTGERRKLPDHLRFHRVSDMTDRVLAGYPEAVRSDPRVARALAAKIRRVKVD
jgi:tetratricopeptide (TPR) repeat protein